MYHVADHANFMQAVLTRVNSISGVSYKDDPTIFGWELMNEPRCQSDLSGKAIQVSITPFWKNKLKFTS